VTSLNSVDGPARTENRKSKLALPRVLRKHSKDDDGERTSSKFEKSPRLLRKTTSGQSANSKDNASTEGSEQDIDAMFKDYEQSEHSKNKSPGQKEFTGWFFCNFVELRRSWTNRTLGRIKRGTLLSETDESELTAACLLFVQRKLPHKNRESQISIKTHLLFVGKCGMIEFTLQYDKNTQELLVIVHSCKVSTSLCVEKRFH